MSVVSVFTRFECSLSFLLVSSVVCKVVFGDVGSCSLNSSNVIKFTQNSPSTQSYCVKYDQAAYTLLYKMKEDWPETFSKLTQNERRSMAALAFSKLLVLAVNLEVNLTQQNGPFSEIFIDQKLTQNSFFETTGGQC